MGQAATEDGGELLEGLNGRQKVAEIGKVCQEFLPSLPLSIQHSTLPPFSIPSYMSSPDLFMPSGVLWFKQNHVLSGIGA